MTKILVGQVKKTAISTFGDSNGKKCTVSTFNDSNGEKYLNDIVPSSGLVDQRPGGARHLDHGVLVGGATAQGVLECKLEVIDKNIEE